MGLQVWTSVWAFVGNPPLPPLPPPVPPHLSPASLPPLFCLWVMDSASSPLEKTQLVHASGVCVLKNLWGEGWGGSVAADFCRNAVNISIIWWQVGLDSVTVVAGLGAVISIRPAVLPCRMSGLCCGLLQGSVPCCGGKKESCCLSLQAEGWICYVFTCILLRINPHRILDSTCLFNIEIWCSRSRPRHFPWMVTFLSYLNDVLHYTFWQRPVRAPEVGVGLFKVCDTYGEEILCKRAVLTKEKERDHCDGNWTVVEFGVLFKLSACVHLRDLLTMMWYQLNWCFFLSGILRLFRWVIFGLKSSRAEEFLPFADDAVTHTCVFDPTLVGSATSQNCACRGLSFFIFFYIYVMILAMQDAAMIYFLV